MNLVAIQNGFKSVQTPSNTNSVIRDNLTLHSLQISREKKETLLRGQIKGRTHLKCYVSVTTDHPGRT